MLVIPTLSLAVRSQNQPEVNQRQTLDIFPALMLALSNGAAVARPPSPTLRTPRTRVWRHAPVWRRVGGATMAALLVSCHRSQARWRLRLYAEATQKEDWWVVYRGLASRTF